MCHRVSPCHLTRRLICFSSPVSFFSLRIALSLFSLYIFVTGKEIIINIAIFKQQIEPEIARPLSELALEHHACFNVATATQKDGQA
jgi:hypothetical protein